MHFCRNTEKIYLTFVPTCGLCLISSFFGLCPRITWNKKKNIKTENQILKRLLWKENDNKLIYLLFFNNNLAILIRREWLMNTGFNRHDAKDGSIYKSQQEVTRTVQPQRKTVSRGRQRCKNQVCVFWECISPHTHRIIFNNIMNPNRHLKNIHNQNVAKKKKKTTNEKISPEKTHKQWCHHPILIQTNSQSRTECHQRA